MIRWFLAGLITIMIIGASVCFITRCTAEVIAEPLDICTCGIKIKPVLSKSKRPDYKKFERELEERRKREKEAPTATPTDDPPGKARFIFE